MKSTIAAKTRHTIETRGWFHLVLLVFCSAVTSFSNFRTSFFSAPRNSCFERVAAFSFLRHSNILFICCTADTGADEVHHLCWRFSSPPLVVGKRVCVYLTWGLFVTRWGLYAWLKTSSVRFSLYFSVRQLTYYGVAFCVNYDLSIANALR